MSKVLIVDYDMGNLGSVRRSFEECGAKVLVSKNPVDLAGVDHIVLPGVGAFAKGMDNLRKMGWVEKLTENVLREDKKLIGICLGMQLLASLGQEGGEVEGLGFIPGQVKMLNPRSSQERVPHVGWNEIYRSSQHAILDDIPDGSDFYFVHSYQFLPEKAEHVLATTPYCGRFVSIVAHRNIVGVQFHPEKSSRFGMQMIKNFLKT